MNSESTSSDTYSSLLSNGICWRILGKDKVSEIVYSFIALMVVDIGPVFLNSHESMYQFGLLLDKVSNCQHLFASYL